jgi:hypothetical protein
VSGQAMKLAFSGNAVRTLVLNVRTDHGMDAPYNLCSDPDSGCSDRLSIKTASCTLWKVCPDTTFGCPNRVLNFIINNPHRMSQNHKLTSRKIAFSRYKQFTNTMHDM